MASFLLGELPDTIGITIGAGGVSQTGTTNGNAGGVTSFGSIISIPGGLGGSNNTTGFNGTLADMTFDKSFTAFNLSVMNIAAGDGGIRNSGNFQAGTTSLLWGNGGNASGSVPTAGAAPGGGGGACTTGPSASGAGGRGEIRFHID